MGEQSVEKPDRCIRLASEAPTACLAENGGAPVSKSILLYFLMLHQIAIEAAKGEPS